jgi:hypothetical protein
MCSACLPPGEDDQEDHACRQEPPRRRGVPVMRGGV